MMFDSWLGILRVLIVGPLAYVSLVVLLRVSGKRTLAKLNAFDLVVTIALGSTFATVLLSKSVPLAEGVTGMIVLVALQYAVAWLSVRSSTISGLVKAEPSLVMRDGAYLDAALKAQRLTHGEILAALRAAGLAGPEGVASVILETDGSLSVVKA